MWFIRLSYYSTIIRWLAPITLLLPIWLVVSPLLSVRSFRQFTVMIEVSYVD
jgi:hypothetical protein